MACKCMKSHMYFSKDSTFEKVVQMFNKLVGEEVLKSLTFKKNIGSQNHWSIIQNQILMVMKNSDYDIKVRGMIAYKTSYRRTPIFLFDKSSLRYIRVYNQFEGILEAFPKPEPLFEKTDERWKPLWEINFVSANSKRSEDDKSKLFQIFQESETWYGSEPDYDLSMEDVLKLQASIERKYKNAKPTW